MQNALTIDLEDYYQVTAFSASRERERDHSYISRVEQNTHRTLEILAEKGCVATFFTVGSVAEEHPRLIQLVVNAGHEIACHSFAHQQIFNLARDQFWEDTRRAKTAIENAAGTRIFGYRAPSFSITRASAWAFEILVELGFTYDSSIFPVKHPSYGVVQSPRFPYTVETQAGSIIEFPLPTLECMKMRAPVGGGAYLRILPYAYTNWAIRYINKREAHPVCVYLHPWELDADQPRMDGPLTSRLRHYMGLRGTEAKLRSLLRDFKFSTMKQLLQEYKLRDRLVCSNQEFVLNPPKDVFTRTS